MACLGVVDMAAFELYLFGVVLPVEAGSFVFEDVYGGAFLSDPGPRYLPLLSLLQHFGVFTMVVL